jgi:hypothetical protein
MHRANTLIWDGPTLQNSKDKVHDFAKPTVRQVVKTTEADLSFNAKHVNAYHTMRGAAVQSPVRRGGCLCCVHVCPPRSTRQCERGMRSSSRT